MNNIKVPNKDSLDLFITATMDSEGWQGKSVVKETDMHMGSKDGRAVFNWRMKFGLTFPCTFPRIKLSVFDFATFSSDESIAYTTLELDDLIKRLSNEGKYHSGRIFLDLENNSNFSKGGNIVTR